MNMKRGFALLLFFLIIIPVCFASELEVPLDKLYVSIINGEIKFNTDRCYYDLSLFDIGEINDIEENFNSFTEAEKEEKINYLISILESSKEQNIKDATIASIKKIASKINDPSIILSKVRNLLENGNLQLKQYLVKNFRVAVIFHSANLDKINYKENDVTQMATADYFQEKYEFNGDIVYRFTASTRIEMINYLKNLHNKGIIKVHEILNLGHGWYNKKTPTSSFIYSFPTYDRIIGSMDRKQAKETKTLLGNAASMVEEADWNFIGCHTAWDKIGHSDIVGRPEASVTASYNEIFNGHGFGYSAGGEYIEFFEGGGFLIPLTIPITTWIKQQESLGYAKFLGNWNIPKNKAVELWNVALDHGVAKVGEEIILSELLDGTDCAVCYEDVCGA